MAPKYVPGMLALCPYCAMSNEDFSMCLRCKRRLPENVKAIPAQSDPNRKEMHKERNVHTTPFFKPCNNLNPEHKTTVNTEDTDEVFLTHVSKTENGNTARAKVSNSRDITISVKSIPALKSARTNQAGNFGNFSANGKVTCSKIVTEVYTTLLNCRMVRIGSYKYHPTSDIELRSDGLLLKVPSVKDVSKIVTINIKVMDLISVKLHCNNSLPLLLLYCHISTALKIRIALGMQNPKGPYFDPTSKDESKKRIILFPRTIPSECKFLLFEMYEEILEVLDTNEANSILVKACITHVPSNSEVRTYNNKMKKTVYIQPASKIQTVTVDARPPKKRPFFKKSESNLEVNPVAISKIRREKDIRPFTVSAEIQINEEQMNKFESKENSNGTVFYSQYKIDDPTTAIVQKQISGNEAKMLILMETGEQRLFTFDILHEDCTVQHLLENASIPFSQDPRVSLVLHPALAINYIVEIIKSSEDQPVPNSSCASPLVFASSELSITKITKTVEQSNVTVTNNPDSSSTVAAATEKTIQNDKLEPNKQTNPKIVIKTGRGCRSRGPLTRQQTKGGKEPEYLTISSDEEDVVNKKSKTASN